MKISDIIYYANDKGAEPTPDLFQKMKNAFTRSGAVKRPLRWPPDVEEPLPTSSARAFSRQPRPETSQPEASHDLSGHALVGERILPDQATRPPMRVHN
jgi:hypothetical protein